MHQMTTIQITYEDLYHKKIRQIVYLGDLHENRIVKNEDYTVSIPFFFTKIYAFFVKNVKIFHF